MSADRNTILYNQLFYHITSCDVQMTGDRVAVKVFTGGPEFKSLKREIDVVKQLPRQENIVELLTVEEDVSFCEQALSEQLNCCKV